jgi:flagellar export protein FliJ
MPTKQQMKTMGRLIDMKARSAELAELAYAEACARTKDAEAALDRAESAWNEALDEFPAVSCVTDLEDRDLRIQGLRRGVDFASLRVSESKTNEEAARAAMTAARIDLRRFETWRDRVTAAQQAEVRRVERIAEDEVAARKQRAG